MTRIERTRSRKALSLALASITAAFWLTPARADDTQAASAAPSAPAAASTAPAGEAADEALRQRVKVLEDLITRMQGELEAMRAEAQRRGATSASPEELQKRIDALSAELARLRDGKDRMPEGKPMNGMDANASRVYLVKRGVGFGGYGSALYERFTPSADDDVSTKAVNQADLTEAFFYFGYRFDDKFLFNSSIGIEHAVAGDGATAGEATMEFAYVDYRAMPALGVRGGLVLMPIGWLNERHEPASYLSVLRPKVEERIIPTTWREIGAGVYGEWGPLTWRAYLTTGLDATGFTPSDGIRGGRQQGSEARAADPAISGRLDWMIFHDRPFGALLAGGSVYTGKTDQDEAGFPPGRLSLMEAHAQYTWNALHVRALAVKTIQSDAGEISLALDPSGNTVIAEREQGWYAEVGYDLLKLLKWQGEKLMPFCRYESLDTQREVSPGLQDNLANDLTVKTCGVIYQPIPNIIIKADASNYDDRAHLETDQINIGLGWSF